jgi:hypothetical protein
VEREFDACSHGAQQRRLPDSSLASHEHHRAATRPHGFNGCRKGLKLSLTLEQRVHTDDRNRAADARTP